MSFDCHLYDNVCSNMYLLVYALRALRYIIYSVVYLLTEGLRYTRFALLDSDSWSSIAACT